MLTFPFFIQEGYWQREPRTQDQLEFANELGLVLQIKLELGLELRLELGPKIRPELEFDLALKSSNLHACVHVGSHLKCVVIAKN